MARWTVAICLSLACGCTCASGGARRDGGVPADAGGMDGAAEDAATGDAALDDAGAPVDARATSDAPGEDGAVLDAAANDGGQDAALDAPMTDAGCAVGSSRACTLMCMGGATAPGRERCLGGDAWGACERPTELCGNAMDDDGDGMVDEDCRVEGGCIWVRPQCQGVMTMNEWCNAAGGRHLVAGRRCAVAGGAVVALDVAYGAYPLCCCDVASMCVPVCEGSACASCVVWDEIQCCP